MKKISTEKLEHVVGGSQITGKTDIEIWEMYKASPIKLAMENAWRKEHGLPQLTPGKGETGDGSSFHF